VRTEVADGALDVLDHVGVGVFGGDAVIDGEDGVACRGEEVGYIGFAAGLAVSAVVAAAVNDDGDGMRGGAFGGVVVHGEGLAVGGSVEDAVLRGCAQFGGVRGDAGAYEEQRDQDEGVQ